MKNVEALFDQALLIVEDCIGEDKINDIQRPIEINSRAKKMWGKCKYDPVNDSFRIEISNRIIQDKVSDTATLNTMIHEILHACKNGMSHKGAWRNYADKINSMYPQFNIQRTTSAESFGLGSEQREITRKYAIECTRCGSIHYSSKLSKSIKHPEWYNCGKCGGSLKRIF